MDPGSSLVGRTLANRFRVVRAIGEGATATVFEAEASGSSRRVAVKVLDAEDEGALDRFRREATATSALAHPRVVKLLEFFGDERPPFLVMELLHGESLATRIDREGRLPIATAVKIALQMLEALAAAHRIGIVHRDVKPSNVFLAGFHDVKLLDFGVAKVLVPESHGFRTATGVIAGTPAFCAPEQLRRQAVDARTDLYAVGVCLYRMIAGEHPYEGHGPVLTAAILRDTPPPLDAVRKDAPSGLAAAVARALEKEMSARFATADEMIAALAPFAEATKTGAVVESHPTLKETRQRTVWARATQRMKTSPLVALVVVLACVLFAGSGIALIFFSLHRR